jgi:hypothetical protein
LVVIGAIEAVSIIWAGGAGAVGAIGGGIVMSTLLEETLVEQNYHEVLNFIVRELWKKMNEQKVVRKWVKQYSRIRREILGKFLNQGIF